MTAIAYIEQNELDRLGALYGAPIIDTIISHGAGWQPRQGVHIENEKLRRILADPYGWIGKTRVRFDRAAIERRPIAQRQTPPVASSPSAPTGAGTELKKLLAKIGIEAKPNCACNHHAQEMDERGTWWCEQNEEKIVGWLREEAKRRKLPFFESAGRIVARRAIRNAADAPHYVFHVSGFGMGDAICGLYAACGLADATGRRVRIHANNEAWLARATHPLVEVRTHRKIGPDTGADYSGEIALADTRKRHYCRMLAKAFGIPEFLPKAPPKIDRTHPKRWPRYAVLAPFSAYESRTWDKWRELAKALSAEGVKPVAIGTGSQQRRLEEVFGPTDATWFYGCSAFDITDIMLGADVVIGNDSGIPHLAGLLGIPAIAIHAGSLPHDFLFELSPSVRSVTPGGILPRSDHNPSALRSIAVERVMGVARGILGIREG